MKKANNDELHSPSNLGIKDLTISHSAMLATFFNLSYFDRFQIFSFWPKMAGYEHSGPVDCDVPFDTANLKGKTAIITGGRFNAVDKCKNLLIFDEQAQMV